MFPEKRPWDGLGDLAGWSCCSVGIWTISKLKKINQRQQESELLACLGKLYGLQRVKTQV